MTYPRLHALGACLISLLYPLMAILCRDAVVPIMVFGALALGVYRYFGILGGMRRGEVPDLFGFFFIPCRKKAPLAAHVPALLSTIAFAALMLLPARILLDISVDWAKPAFFAPCLYCAVAAILVFNRTSDR